MSRCPPSPFARESVVLIGNFDGVHRGHQSLAAVARARAAGGSCRALVFDPHPLTLIRPERAPARLTTFDDRAGLLRRAGADDIVRLEPTRQMLERTPEQFANWLCETFAPTLVVEGEDFCFGKGRAGNVEILSTLGQRRGFKVEVVPPASVTLDDHSVVKASSSLCRWLLSQGRVADAALILGRPHSIVGQVVPGDRRGRTIGFPTANIDSPIVLPADGVYAGRATLPDGRVLPAAVNIGARPTFAGAARTVEAHLIQPEAPATWGPISGLSEYGWTIRVELVAFLRDQVRFAGLEPLKAQLTRDCVRAVGAVDSLASPVSLPEVTFGAAVR